MGNNRATAKALRQRRLAPFNVPLKLELANKSPGNLVTIQILIQSAGSGPETLHF